MLRIQILAILFLSCSGSLVAQDQAAWKLQDVLSGDSSLTLYLHNQSRFEQLVGKFRPGQRTNDHVLAYRTGLFASYDFGAISLTGELLDARQAFARSSSFIGTGIVNSMDILQAFVSFDLHDDFKLDIGRFTRRMGTNRFMARNVYRNTINSFTGVYGSWSINENMKVEPFFLLPVERLPSSTAELLENQSILDEQSFNTQFYGVHFQTTKLVKGIIGEVTLFRLYEEGVSSRNRRLTAPTFRFYRQPFKGRVHFDLESMYQFGTSGLFAADTRGLKHAAHFQHLKLGYTSNASKLLRYEVMLDVASGDKDPDDNKNNRFDTLYGALRFDYGPPSIFVAFRRENIVSPGFMVTMEPWDDWQLKLTSRYYWLASSRDTYTAINVQDHAGASGTNLGSMTELVVRWDVIPQNLSFEAGFSQLFLGSYVDRAAPNDNLGDISYGFFQTLIRM